MVQPQYKNNSRNNGKSTLRRRTLLFGAAIVVLSLVLGVLELTNTTHFFHKQSHVLDVDSNTPTTGGASVNSQKGEPHGGSSAGDSQGDSTGQPGDTKNTTDGLETTVLLIPSGDFVSNHHPNLSGEPAPNTLTSVCTSTPGAVCTISFTNGGVVKHLPAQTTDRGGSAYWNGWSLHSVGLTAGSWIVTATVTWQGQTKSATDDMQLVVEQ